MREQLLQVVRDARRRWRLRLALRGLALLAGVALVAAVGGAFVLDRLRFAPWAVRATQLAVWATLAAVAWRAVGRALWRRVSDTQVALYLEEHEPELGGRLLAAVAFAGRDDGRTSPDLVERLVRDAVSRAESHSGWRDVERPGIRRASLLLAAGLLAGLVAGLARPGFLAVGLPFLLPTRGAASPYSILVSPGDTVIARGADLELRARMRGFTSDQADLLIRRHDGERWDRLDLSPDETTGLHGIILFDVRESFDHTVEAAGVRSPVHTVRVADLPWVAGIALVLEFPRYTGLPHQTQEGGDVAALTGTTVRVSLRPTIAVSAGALAILGGDTIALAADTGGTLAGSFTIERTGEYRVLFPGPDGRLLPGSPPYAIEALEDQPPLVTVTRPGRDADATPIEEVFFEVTAEDDYGLRGLELVYSVNGGDGRTVGLGATGGRKEVVAAHTLFLEELDLEPGDVISYFARAADGRRGAEPALSDIYFLSIRPFDRTFREAEQSGMPGDQQGSTNPRELSERQRQIIAATFRLQRERAEQRPSRLREDAAVITLGQGRLREEVETLLRRMRERGVLEQDSAMALVAGELDSAIAAMRAAEGQLGRRDLEAALAPEQRALSHLQRAEAIFESETRVARSRQQGGGGRGEGNPQAEELADLFELELDRMQNQYETVQREDRQNADLQVDEALERLRELARRQQQEAERRRAEASRGTGSAGGGQRRLAEETDSLARQLERLSRQQRRPELADAARRMREAAEQMRRSAASRDGGAAAGAATDRLREAQTRLDRSRDQALRRQVEEARERARRLANQQDEIRRDVERLQGDAPAERTQRLQRLGERKNLMAGEVRGLGRDLDRLAREAQQGQPDAAGRLREAARDLREGRTEDMIRFSRGTLNARAPEYARAFEEQIGERLDSLASRLDAALAAIGDSREDRVERALERTRDVAGALEALRERGRREQAGPAPDGQAAGPDPRQLGRELRERTRELGDIRSRLRREGVDTRPLDELLGMMGSLGDIAEGSLDRVLRQLDQVIVPGLREFEFGVRRSAGGAPDLPRLGSEAVAPAEWRQRVEEYYRALAEGRP